MGNNDAVAFCGYMIEIITLPGGAITHTYRGVIGWFTPTIVPNGSVYFHYCIIPEIYKFDKIEPFFNNSSYFSYETIVAIGEMHYNYHKYAIFYMDNFLNPIPMTNCPYKIYEAPSGEILTDIVRSEHYVSFVGFEWNNSGVCIRKEQLSNLNSPVLLHNRYTFSYTEDQN